MRVLHVIGHLDTGGAESLLAHSIKFYRLHAIELDLLVIKKGDSFLNDIVQKSSGGGIFYLTNKSIYNIRLVFKIIPILRRYDLIHVHLFPAFYWVFFAHLFVRDKKVLFYTEHSTKNKRRSISLFRYIDRYLYKRFDRIVCISHSVRDSLIKQLGIDSKNVTVIYNGIDLDRFMKDATFDFNFFNRKSFILMQISRFTESKDQETVIRALKHLPDVIKLVLVGSGETLKKNQAIVLNLNLTERVKFLGDRSDVPELIAYSSVIVQSSFYEGFGLAALEGMSSERPVIGSNVSGLVELLSGWGLLFECGNDVELADIIYKLYTERDYYNHIARRCYLRSREYSIEKMVSKYVEEYKKFKY